MSTDVKPDIERLKSSQTTKTMDCIDCHNRVGHAVPSPDRAIDEAIGAGKISTNLPFIKRDSVALLNGDYPTLEAADTAINGLRATYAAKYPLALKTQAKQVTAAIDELKVQYRLIATPAMKVQAKTYPDNLGHQTSLGCFRCHDGAHYLVVKGKITNKTIPSECSTCHTFPQIGASASSFPLGGLSRPPTRTSSTCSATRTPPRASTRPGRRAPPVMRRPTARTATRAVRSRSSTPRCSTTTPAAIKTAGGTQACAYCHLPVYCAKCHKGPVLDPNAPAPGTPVAVKPRPAS